MNSQENSTTVVLLSKLQPDTPFSFQLSNAIACKLAAFRSTTAMCDNEPITLHVVDQMQALKSILYLSGVVKPLPSGDWKSRIYLYLFQTEFCPQPDESLLDFEVPMDQFSDFFEICMKNNAILQNKISAQLIRYAEAIDKKSPLVPTSTPIKVPVPVPTKSLATLNQELRTAACNGRLETVKYLVSQGADIHAERDEAVQNAAANGHLEIVQYLVNQGADIHAESDAAVKWAARNGHLAIVHYLVIQGADIHAGNDVAVRWAAENGHLEIVQYLVSQGADIRADGDGAVRWAARNARLETVKYLVSQGADIRANEDWAIKHAARNGLLETVKYLVSQGADVSHVSKEMLVEILNC